MRTENPPPTRPAPGAGAGPGPLLFEQWARARQHGLRRTAYLLCGDWDHAQDLVQETLVRLYGRWCRLEPAGNTDGYARRVLTNLYIDERRRRSSSERPIALVPDHAGHDESADGDVATRLTLLGALARMPRSQRAVLVLRYWEDLSTAQTAQALGCSIGNVKSQASRGLIALRAELQSVGVDLTTPDDEDDGTSGPWTAREPDAAPARPTAAGAPDTAADGLTLTAALALLLPTPRFTLITGGAR